LAANRPDYFPDVDSYEQVYQHASNGNFSDIDYWLSHGEPGFKIISYILSLLNFSFQYFLLFFAISSFVFLLIISNIANVSYSYLWFLYLSMYFITRDLGIIRVSLASHLIVIALCQKRFFHQFIILFVSSFFFQYFSFIALLPCILAKYKVNLKLLFLLLLMGFVFKNSISFDRILFLVPSLQADTYSETDLVIRSNGNNFLPIIRNGIFTFLVISFFIKNKTNQIISGWIWMALFSTLFYIMLSNIPIMAQRFSAYYATVLPVAIAYKLDNLAKRNILFHLLIIFIILNFISVFYYNDFVWH